MITIAVQAADFDTGQEIRQLQADRTDVGGIAIFTGQVRDTGDKPLGFMHLEHYPGMTEASLQQTAEQAAQRWALIDIRIVHRIGDLLPGDQSGDQSAGFWPPRQPDVMMPEGGVDPALSNLANQRQAVAGGRSVPQPFDFIGGDQARKGARDMAAQQIKRRT